MTRLVELPLVTQHAHRTVWVNAEQVGSLESSTPAHPDRCWVTMVWGCRHHVELPMGDAAALLGGERYRYVDLRESVLENLTRG